MLQYNLILHMQQKYSPTGRYLKSIMATAEVCGCQEIPLRGHNDDAMHLLDDIANNFGYF